MQIKWWYFPVGMVIIAAVYCGPLIAISALDSLHRVEKGNLELVRYEVTADADSFWVEVHDNITGDWYEMTRCGSLQQARQFAVEAQERCRIHQRYGGFR